MKNLLFLRFILGFFFLLLSHFSISQSLDKIYIDETANGQKLSDFISIVEKTNKVDFIYDNVMIDALTINGVKIKMRLSNYLNTLLEGFNLTVIEVQDDVFLIAENYIYLNFGLKKSNYIILPADTKTLKGNVEDAFTNEKIPGTQVSILGSTSGTLTDLNGNFAIKTRNSFFQLSIQYLGYEEASYFIGFSPLGKASNNIQINLYPESTELEGVVITSKRIDNNVSDKISGVETLTIEKIKSLPTFMGEVDPIKSLTTLPGVSTVGEVSSGFNVRGGESGQNLILQDGTMVYNPTHLFGFFSAFNPDMVSNVTLYKGGGSAKYGGKVSSVLDIQLKNGNTTNHKVSGGVGLISSRLTAQGPIIKGRTSYLIGGRVSYSNWLLKSANRIELKNSAANFYDFNFKVFHKLNNSNYLTLSSYYSHDDFKLQSDSTFNWSTKNVALRWDHTFNINLSSSLVLANSNYSSDIENTDQLNAFNYQNHINNTSLKYEFDNSINDKIGLNYGFEVSRTTIEPGKIEPTSDISLTLKEDIDNQQSIESAVFLQSDIDITSRLAISAGLRFSHFLRYGPGKTYSFDYNDINGRFPTITDSLEYSDGETIKTYYGIEPRISLRYLINENTSLKLSYYRGTQYQHQISNTTSVAPQDYWILSGPNLKPNRSNQYSFGIFKNIKRNLFEVSTEVFYKNINNTVDYIEGADVAINKTFETGIVQGDGLAYGAELQITKQKGTVNGWLSYTYSRSLRKFDGNNEISVINNGKYYASNFDQPHNLSLVLNVLLGLRTTFSANFSYSTGRPITIPISKFGYDSYLAVLNYSKRNEYRIPDYHRLDISMTYKPKVKKNQRYQEEWVISIFNVYNRRNAYSIYFNEFGSARKLSILGTIFPSITYNFKF